MLGLTYDERREVQRRLTVLGYNTYGIDGDLGSELAPGLGDVAAR